MAAEEDEALEAVVGDEAAERAAEAAERATASAASAGVGVQGTLDFGDGLTAARCTLAAYAGGEVLTAESDTLAAFAAARGERPVVAHDWKTIASAGRASRPTPPPLAHDTMVAAYLIDPARRGYPLEELADARSGWR